MNRNLTLNLPEQLLSKLRVRAAIRNQSMTSLVKEAIERVVDEEDARHATQRLLNRIRNAADIGLSGKVSWSRAELHDR